MRRFGAWLLGRWRALDFDLRDAEFYGGLILVGAGTGRWPIVGAVLAAHAWATPFLLRGSR